MSAPAWELVERQSFASDFFQHTYRLPVPGGWLYRWAEHCGAARSTAMVFVPTPAAGVGACPHTEGKTQAECEHCRSWLASCIKKGG